MRNEHIIQAYISLISNGDFTHAITLKPNSIMASAAGQVFHITSKEERFQLTATHIKTDRMQESLNTNFNDAALFSKLHRFHGRLDRALVGRRFYEPKYAHLRTKIIAICEGTIDTGHLHCSIRVHESRLPKFREMFPSDLTASEGKAIWNKVAIGGTLKVEELYDADGWASYMTKSLVGDNLTDRIKILP